MYSDMPDIDKANNAASDEKLLALYAQDKTNRYIGELFGRYIPMVYGVCLRYLRNTDDAGDAVMDIFEELTAKAGRYEIREFRPWLYVLTKNHCLQKLRRCHTELPEDIAAPIVECLDVVKMLDGDVGADDRARLEECMDKLPDKQRECIIKFFYDDKSYADIAAETLYPLKSVKSLLQNGKRNLKICLERGNNETD